MMMSLLKLLVSLVPLCQAADEWYKHEYEYNYIEALMLMVFVVIAIIFETVWHHASHKAEHTYMYGNLHRNADAFGHAHAQDNHGSVIHRRLWEELLHRTGSEFMSLGVLAFLIFNFNQLGGFKLLANLPKISKDLEFTFPNTYEDYLHTAEAVHVGLFIGMVLYFILMSQIVRGSADQIMDWESLRLRRIRNLLKGKPECKEGSIIEVHLNNYCTWRNYFVGKVCLWKHARPELFREVMDSLHLDADAKDAEELLNKELSEQFAFSSYLAVNLENGMRDMIEVHQYTWLAVLVIFGICAFLHRVAKISFLALPPFFALALAIGVARMRMFNKRGEARILNFVSKHKLQDGVIRVEVGGDDANEDLTPKIDSFQSGRLSIHERHQTDMGWLRALQAVLFLNSYGFARTIIDYPDWVKRPLLVLVLCIIYTVLFILLGRYLASQIPLFLSLCALPPFVDHANLELFFSVLLDQHTLQDAVDVVQEHSGRPRTNTGQSGSRFRSRGLSLAELAGAAPVSSNDSGHDATAMTPKMEKGVSFDTRERAVTDSAEYRETESGRVVLTSAENRETESGGFKRRSFSEGAVLGRGYDKLFDDNVLTRASE